jgi:hypothetical protein
MGGVSAAGNNRGCAELSVLMPRRALRPIGFAVLALTATSWPASAYTPACDTARYTLRTLNSAIELYALEHGAYPASENWFEELKRSHTIDSALVNRDPWGRAYVYRRLGDGFDLFTTGPDGLAATADDQVKASDWKWGVCHSPRRCGAGSV